MLLLYALSRQYNGCYICSLFEKFHKKGYIFLSFKGKILITFFEIHFADILNLLLLNSWNFWTNFLTHCNFNHKIEFQPKWKFFVFERFGCNNMCNFSIVYWFNKVIHKGWSSFRNLCTIHLTSAPKPVSFFALWRLPKSALRL